MTGGAGTDTLTNGTGDDTLSGEAGGDTFVFNALPGSSLGADVVTDFLSGTDVLRLDSGAFTALSNVTVVDAFTQGLLTYAVVSDAGVLS
jgi:Ca2+-binding RTX toxin-like protein